MKHLFIILLCIHGIINFTSATKNPDVTAPTGKIRGSIMRTRLGKKIFAFRGVRYGEPPVGERRFQVAIPAADWDDVFNATEEGPGCPNLGGHGMSEDCLRLNVYTTKLQSKSENVKRPVIVFFHPGAFYTFSGQSLYFGPQYMLDKDVVLVTVNYRLGTLGFLSTGDAQAPGNLGLKDQVLALHWVQRNIAAFGGDPNSVTISGYSAGGLSVILHMLSPMSKNLFHRAIGMSGSTQVTRPFPADQKHIAKKQADLLGCPSDTTEAMLTCFRSKPVENFTDTMSMFFEWYGDPILVFEPVVEPEIEGVERFLTDQPLDLIRKGQFHQVPLIAGITKDEFGGISVLYEIPARNGDDSLYREIDANWTTIAPISFMYERGTPRSEYISQELRKLYFKDQPINSPTRQGIADIYSDSAIIFHTYRIAKLIAANSKAPVYFYKFTFQGRKSFSMWNDTTPYGVEHQDDLQYLFFMEAKFPYVEKNAPEIPMLEIYTSMWTNFVQTGEPIPKSKEFKDVVWDRYEPEKDNYLEINLNPTMKTGIYPERMRGWERIFPLSPLP